jgi:hypothetical protein
MFGEQNKLKDLFDRNGWELIESQNPNNDWIAELWLIKSTWSPTDCRIFLSFDVDPQWTDRTRKNFGVWAATISLNQPYDWNEENNNGKFETSLEENRQIEARITLGRRWERNIPKFFEELANLRSKYNNLKK